jgi:hypothetical protein
MSSNALAMPLCIQTAATAIPAVDWRPTPRVNGRNYDRRDGTSPNSIPEDVQPRTGRNARQRRHLH